MRAAYTRTASPHRWMRWHALAYARTASAHFLALDVLACASIHQDYVPAALDALACAMHTPGLHPATVGCAGMHVHTPRPHLRTTFFVLTDMRTRRAASVTSDAPGMRAHTPGTASPRYRVHWHARAYTRPASLRYRSWMHWYAKSIRQYCIRAQQYERDMIYLKQTAKI